jgi:hypothetical protein
MSQQINTVQQFAEACKTLDSNAIYELFEFDLGEEMRDKIYAIADDINASEPARLAFNLIGVQYNVESLKNY